MALGDLRTYTAEQPLPPKVGGRYGAYEVIAIINAGTSPVLSLPRSEWPTVGLLYDPDKFRDDRAYRPGPRSSRPLPRMRWTRDRGACV